MGTITTNKKITRLVEISNTKPIENENDKKLATMRATLLRQQLLKQSTNLKRSSRKIDSVQTDKESPSKRRKLSGNEEKNPEIEKPSGARNLNRNLLNDSVQEIGQSSGEKSALFIDGFKRPLQLKKVEIALSKYGNIEAFKMNNIKSHCFVIYDALSSADACKTAMNLMYFPANIPTIHAGQLKVESAPLHEAMNFIHGTNVKPKLPIQRGNNWNFQTKKMQKEKVIAEKEEAKEEKITKKPKDLFKVTECKPIIFWQSVEDSDKLKENEQTLIDLRVAEVEKYYQMRYDIEDAKREKNERLKRREDQDRQRNDYHKVDRRPVDQWVNRMNRSRRGGRGGYDNRNGRRNGRGNAYGDRRRDYNDRRRRRRSRSRARSSSRSRKRRRRKKSVSESESGSDSSKSSVSRSKSRDSSKSKSLKSRGKEIPTTTLGADVHPERMARINNF